MFIDLVIGATKSILQEEPDVPQIVAARVRKERWFQEKIYRRLTQTHPDIIVRREEN
jgi:hypothetical protein